MYCVELGTGALTVVDLAAVLLTVGLAFAVGLGLGLVLRGFFRG